MFPLPDYIRMPAFGIDISSDDVRYVELLPHGTEMRLGRYGSVPLAEGVVSRGKVEDPAALARVLKDIAKKEHIHWANIALPEEQSFLTQMDLPRISRKDLRGSVELHLEEYVPIPPRDASFDCTYIGEDNENTHALAGVLPSSVVDQYMELCKSAGIVPKVMEFQSHAMARAMFEKNARGAYMGVDIGRDLTHIFIIYDRDVHFSALLDMGGHDVTNAIAKKLDIPYDEADAMKIRLGLVGNSEHPDVREATLPILAQLREHIMRYFTYWQHRHDGGLTIERVVLTGGGSNLVGIVEYLGQGVNAMFSIANPWVNICDFEKYIPPVTHKEAQGYTTAIGLALRSDYLE